MSAYKENVKKRLESLLAPILMVFEENWSGYKEAPEVFPKDKFEKELDILVEDIFTIFKEEKVKLQ